METFLDRFPDFQVINVQEPTNYLLEELMRDKNKRFLAQNYSRVRQLIMDDKVEDALNILKKASDESSSFVSLQAVDIIHDTSRYETYLDKINNYDKYFIKTGFPELDDIIYGWDVNEDLVTIVARNGLGKSWLLFKCAAEAAKQGKRVGLYSGEMSEDSVGYRIDSVIGHIANGSLLHGNGSIKNQYKNYLDNLSANVPGSIYILTPKQINGMAGVSALRAFVEKYNLDVLFIDQHSLLDDDRKGKGATEKAANISTDLKLLQTTKRIPIIAVCQQNRNKLEDDKNGKIFDTTQVAVSDKIAQDSSIVIFIERKDDLMKLHLTKSRQSGAGNILTYKVDLNLGTWQYIIDEKSEKSEEYIESSGYSDDEVF